MVILAFTSDKFRYIILVQRHWCCYCSDWSFESFSLCPHWDLTWGPLDLKSCTLLLCHGDSGFHLWQFQVFNCGAEGLGVVLFWLYFWVFFFFPTLGFELGTSGSHVLHSTTVPLWLLVLISDNLRYLTVVQMDGGGIVLIGSVRDFLFALTGIWTGDLWISSPALYYCAMVILVFTSDNFRYITMEQRE